MQIKTTRASTVIAFKRNAGKWSAKRVHAEQHVFTSDQFLMMIDPSESQLKQIVSALNVGTLDPFALADTDTTGPTCTVPFARLRQAA